VNERLRKRLAAIEGQAEHKDSVKTRNMPNGWEPGVVWDGTKGEITTDPSFDPNADWDDLLASRGLDPNVYEIVGDTIRWTSFDGWKRDAPGEEAYSTICYSFKAEIRKKVSDTGNPVIPEDVYQAVLKAKKPKKAPPKGDSNFVVALSDWQTGNRDGGGIELQAQKIADLVESIPNRIADLRLAGILSAMSLLLVWVIWLRERAVTIPVSSTGSKPTGVSRSNWYGEGSATSSWPSAPSWTRSQYLRSEGTTGKTVVYRGRPSQPQATTMTSPSLSSWRKLFP